MTLTARTDVQLVTVTADDGRELEGLLHEPVGRPAAAVLHLHGKGGNCYSGSARFIPELTAGANLRHLALNMRCHDLGYTRADVRYQDFSDGAPADADGGCWERLSLGPTDVAAGVRALRELGPEPIYIAGHSSGGFYTATYTAHDPDIAGRILLSPLTSNRRPLPAWFGDDGQVEAALVRAREMVASGEGRQLIPVRKWYYAISAESLVERAAEDDAVWLTAMQASDSPVLLLWGSAESRDPLWRALFEEFAATDKEIAVVEGADHNYVGHETVVAKAVGNFIAARV